MTVTQLLNWDDRSEDETMRIGALLLSRAQKVGLSRAEYICEALKKEAYDVDVHQLKVDELMDERKVPPTIALDAAISVAAAVIADNATSLEQAELDAKCAAEKLVEMVRENALTICD